MLLHVLFEHAAGYALFAVKEVEEIGMLLPQVGPRWSGRVFSTHQMAPISALSFRWSRAS